MSSWEMRSNLLVLVNANRKFFLENSILEILQYTMMNSRYLNFSTHAQFNLESCSLILKQAYTCIHQIISTLPETFQFSLKCPECTIVNFLEKQSVTEVVYCALIQVSEVKSFRYISCYTFTTVSLETTELKITYTKIKILYLFGLNYLLRCAYSIKFKT